MTAVRPLILLDPFPRTETMVYSSDAAAALAGMGRVVAHFGSRAPDSLVESMLPEVAVIVGQTAMPKERLDRARKLRAILNVKGNWEPNVDYAAAQARGVHVLSAAPAMAPAVAEYCLGQAIALARGLNRADFLFRSGEEAYGIAGNAAAYSLFGSEVAILGYGNLGRALVPVLRPFGCRISVHDPWVSDGFLRTEGVAPVSLDAALSSSQFLFLLAGVTTENEGGLDGARLSRIRKDATVILASRAEIVDFGAFLELAAAGRFRAAVDVYPEEPVAAGDPVRVTPNVLFSSHLAGGTELSYGLIREMMLDDIGQILRGLPPLRMQRADPRLALMMRSK